MLGNHALKFGADIRRVRDDLLQGNNNAAAGTFYFSENQTSAPGGKTGLANDIASVLFDVPYQVGQDPKQHLSLLPADVTLLRGRQVAGRAEADHRSRCALRALSAGNAGGFVNYNPANNQLVLAGE